MAKKRAKKVSRKPRVSQPRKSGFGVIKIPRGVSITWGSEWSPLNITDTGYETDDGGKHHG